ncbi:MAG: glycosyltransferase family 4 protein [Acidobacteria bacterium]|nr:MAG: glycosyltransferase family 4 protein [Acidobacteriota bacterium]
MQPLRIAHVGPVATTIPPPRSGSVETMTSLLTEGLVARGHDVTLFATGDSRTKAKLHALYQHGYNSDPNMWPWELYEMFNLSAAVERAAAFDVIHYQSRYYPLSLAFGRLSPTPIVQTVHHKPSAQEVALWSGYPDAAFVAISGEQARCLSGLNVVATILHGIDTDRFVYCDQPEDYVLFLGRFAEGKGVRQAIDIARALGLRLLLAAEPNPYYWEHVAPFVDGKQVVYVGEVDFDAKVRLYGGARALLYPVQADEPFGLVLAEAMACGTPVAALDRGAVREIVEDGVTGIVYRDLEQMIDQFDRVLALARHEVRRQAVASFGVDRMVDAYLAVYRRLVEARRSSGSMTAGSR